MLSFIVPVYKTPEPLLRNCLDSILQYSHPMELICVLDSPDDSCGAVLEEYAARESRIRLLQNERNRGVSYTRNRGALNAKGEYLAFVDADDEIYCEAYEKAVELIDKQGLSACVVTANGQKEARFGVRYGDFLVSNLRSVEYGGVIAAAYCWAIYPMVVDRNTWFASVGGFAEDQRFGEDFIAVVKLLCSTGCFAFLNLRGYKSVGHPASACRGAQGSAPYVQGLVAVRSVLADVTSWRVSGSAIRWYLLHTIPFALLDRRVSENVKGSNRAHYIRILGEFAEIVTSRCGNVVTGPVRILFQLVQRRPGLWFLPGMPLSFVLHVLCHFKLLLRA